MQYNPIQSNTNQYNQGNVEDQDSASLAGSLDEAFWVLPTQQDQRSKLHASAALGTPTVGLQYCPLRYLHKNLMGKGLMQNVFSRLWDAPTKTNLLQT